MLALYNWRKYKPNLYRIVMLGFKFDELLENSKNSWRIASYFKLFSIQLSLLLKSRIDNVFIRFFNIIEFYF